MKTIKNTLVVATLVMGMLTSYAVEKLSKGNQISISDASGKIIYKAKVQKNIDLKRLFDFSALKNGKYIIEVNRDFEIEIETIEVKNNKVTRLENTSKKVHKPVFRFNDAQLIISKIAFDIDTINVELYFEDDLIYTETIKSDEAIIDRVYRLDNTQTGNYKAIIKANNREFIRNFEI